MISLLLSKLCFSYCQGEHILSMLHTFVSNIYFESDAVWRHISLQQAENIWNVVFISKNSLLSPAHTTRTTYLLHLSCSTSKQLDISFPQDLLVLLQGVLGVFFAGEEHKSVASRPSVRVLDKEQALWAICDWALGTEEGQHFLGCGNKRQPSHTDNHLVLFGQELGHLVRRA